MTSTISTTRIPVSAPSIWKEDAPNFCLIAIGAILAAAKMRGLGPSLSYKKISILPLCALLRFMIPKIVHHASNNAVITEFLAHCFEKGLPLLKDYTKERIVFAASDTLSYDALVVKRPGYDEAHPEREVWQLCSYGNNEGYERNLRHALNTEVNTLLINGPGVGKSKGTPNRTNWGFGVKCALEYLEKLGTKKIILFGRSLGGGATGEGILQHTLKEDVSYAFMAEVTFSRLSTEAGHLIATKVFRNIPIISQIVRIAITSLLRILRVELDAASGAYKLLKADHRVVVFQNTNGVEGDGVIMTAATLARGLRPMNRLNIISLDCDHNADLFRDYYQPALKLLSEAPAGFRFKTDLINSPTSPDF